MRRGMFWAAVVWATVRSASAQQIIDRDTTLDQFTSNFAGPIWIVDGPERPTSVEMVDGADIGSTIGVFGRSTLNIRGGSTGSFVFAEEMSTVNIFGGNVAQGEDVIAKDNAVVNMFGGQVGDDVFAVGSGVAHVFGGHVPGTLGVQQDGVVHVYLQHYELLPPDGISPLDQLRGVLSDGSSIHVTLYIDDIGLGSGHLEFHVVPEPGSLRIALGLLAIVMVAAGRKLRRPVYDDRFGRGARL